MRRELGNRHGEATSLGNLGNNYERLGDAHCEAESLRELGELPAQPSG